MGTVATLIFILLALVVAFFLVPWSKTKAEFESAVKSRAESGYSHSDLFSEDDIKDLPSPVRRYFRYCGYIGTVKMSYMKATFKDVDFILSDSKTVKINYTQYNFVEEPERFAYISSSMYGIQYIDEEI